MQKINLGRKVIDSKSLYFIADIGANHNGSLDKAKELIKLAKVAGADAVKFQNFKAAKIVSKYGFDNIVNKSSHQSKWRKTVYEVYEDASIELNWTKELKRTCEENNVDYFTSPYDVDSIDFVDPFVDLYKVGSGDLNWTEIIKHIISKDKPTLIATGASDWAEVKTVMETFEEERERIVLMQCNTNYSGADENIKYCNLNVLKAFQNEYPETILGLSDHTKGNVTVLGAIALGARVIEKHFTDDNNQEGPDHTFAMNPTSWREMVDRSYELLSALGDGVKRVEDNEIEAQKVQRRCVRTTRELNVGEYISEEDITILRPLGERSFAPSMFETLVGKQITTKVNNGEHLSDLNVAL